MKQILQLSVSAGTAQAKDEEDEQIGTICNGPHGGLRAIPENEE
jgi:hypothetical protein